MDRISSSVCAVVISYKPPSGTLDNLKALLEQVGHVVVVDNTPNADVATLIEELAHLERCTVIRNGRNLGIAAALNIGYRYAIGLGFPWIITFDQDSRISEGFIEAMLASYEEAAKSSRVALVFPRYRDARLNTFLYTHRDTRGEAFASMTSGTLMRADVFRRIGPMEEALFIDYVDIEYCLRARAAGLTVVESRNAILDHSLGRITSHQRLWRIFTTTNHSAERRYYITRNRLVLVRRYFIKDREWAIADLKGIVLDAIKICAVETDKVRKVVLMMRAISDALRGRLGPRVKL